MNVDCLMKILQKLKNYLFLMIIIDTSNRCKLTLTRNGILIVYLTYHVFVITRKLVYNIFVFNVKSETINQNYLPYEILKQRSRLRF